jgi:hypothetical protein
MTIDQAGLSPGFFFGRSMSRKSVQRFCGNDMLQQRT